ncbi:CAP domain-containing protein [Archangium violaceum]|uniref:CAP domain-containing protein n=1 Tax=Archangium violaceum TaxID=83451 RepID=UPI00193BD422|nr:CAP domain-containing protein [Archangium violaceum]QRK07912.1 CAP domain-containing protein [Archangium violaceum]
MNRKLSVPSILLGVTLLAGCGADAPLTHEEEGIVGEPLEETLNGEELQAQAVTPAAYCDDVTTWDPAWENFENQVLTLVNQRRAAGATCGGVAKPKVGPLTLDTRLRCAARKHSKDMGTNKYFAHNSQDGTTPWTRITNAGYVWRSAAENIAAGQSTPASVVDGWMKSTGHCNNIMNGNLLHLGVGYAYVAGSPYGHYWTQDFGRQ